MDVFGKRLAQLRKEQKLSQTQLAKQLSTSISVISRYERGEMTPSIDNAKKLAGLLNTTVGYLLGEKDEAKQLNGQNLQRLADLELLSGDKKKVLYDLIDTYIRDAKV